MKRNGYSVIIMKEEVNYDYSEETKTPSKIISDPMPTKEDRFEFDEEILMRDDVTGYIDIQETKQFTKDYEKLTPSERKLVKAFKKEISEGILYDQGPAGGDTHFLGSFSSNIKEFHRISRKINVDDRFNCL